MHNPPVLRHYVMLCLRVSFSKKNQSSPALRVDMSFPDWTSTPQLYCILSYLYLIRCIDMKHDPHPAAKQVMDEKDASYVPLISSMLLVIRNILEAKAISNNQHAKAIFDNLN